MEKTGQKSYKNYMLPVEDRVDNLMSCMTPLEKVCQLSTAYAYAGNLGNMDKELKAGIGQIGMSSGTLSIEKNADLVNTVQHYLMENTRLGIPALFHAETLNGGALVEATTYPIPLGLAASWDIKKVEEMGEDISEEMAACGMKLALAPVLDISRDPRWGRMGETYGECPVLTSAMGTAYIKGIQGGDGETGMAACAKHFLGYAASEGGLNMSGAHISARELREVYAKPFEAAFHLAGLKCVMNGYAAIDGEPIAASRKYLTDLLRGELGFNGLTVSDYGSMDKLYDVYCLAKDKTEAGIMALKAGLDTETPRRICLGEDFVSRLENGDIPPEIVDIPLLRLLRLKFELGLFENPYVDADKMKTAVRKKEHKEKAYDLACESMVLLKNENQILPLTGKQKKVAVIGPCGNDLRALFGGYTYPAFYEGMLNMLTGMAKSMGLEGVEAQDSQKLRLKAILSQFQPVEQVIADSYSGISTVYDAIKESIEKEFPETETAYAQGCSYMGKNKDGFAEAVELAEKSDVVILLLGGKNGSGHECTMGENVDSCNIGLPGVQEELARDIKKIGKPIILVHMDGRPLSSVWAKENADAMIEAWHPGQCGAQAIVHTLVGRNNPCGKLPVTAVRHAGQVPVYAEQNKGSGVSGRGGSNSSVTQGYVEEPGFPLYPFGYGSSYTTFEITDYNLTAVEGGTVAEDTVKDRMNAGNVIPADGKITVSCVVTNTGTYPGAEILQLYFADKMASMVRPYKELAGFQRVFLQPGESRKIIFTFSADQTAFIDTDENWRVEEGDIEILLGNSSENLYLVGTVRIENTRILPDSRRTYYCK